MRAISAQLWVPPSLPRKSIPDTEISSGRKAKSSFAEFLLKKFLVFSPLRGIIKCVMGLGSK